MDWVIQLVEQLGYVGMFAIVLLENLIPPIPSEVVLPFAGFMTQEGVVTVPGVIFAATLGSVTGALYTRRLEVWRGEQGEWITSFIRT